MTRLRTAVPPAVRWMSCGALLALGFGCSSGVDTTGAPVGRESSAIIGGTASPSSQDAVVLVALRSGGALKGACTGTLVAPNLVLTARHCVSNTDEGAVCSAEGVAIDGAAVHGDLNPSDLYIYTGVDAISGIETTSKAAARGKQFVHESVTTLCNADVAFIVLDRSIQGEIAPIRLHGGAREGEVVTAVGWGLTESGSLPTKRLQRTGVSVVAIGPLVIDPKSTTGIGPSEFVVREAFCSGDSGGPSFSSSGAVIGVVSRGGGGGMDTTNPASNCIGADVVNFYTHLGAKSALVDEAFTAAGAQPRDEGDPPGSANGASCTEDLDCSSDACVSNTCRLRCDDGTQCAADELCTAYQDKKICTPAPAPANPDVPSGTEANASSAAPKTTTTTTTTGCSAVALGSGAEGSGGVLLALGAAFASIARRARRKNGPSVARSPKASAISR